MPYPHMNNLLIAVPHTGRPIPLKVMYARVNMVLPMSFNYMMMTAVGESVDVARNAHAQFAIEKNCKYIWFWDEDVVFPPQTIPELVYRMEHHPEAAVIGGVYCLKRDPAEPLLFRGNGNGPYWDWKAGEFFEVTGMGMGCTMIRTEVFKDIKKPWFKTEFNYTGLLDAQRGVEAWSEDLWFCRRVVDTGKWKIYADSSLLCGHHSMDSDREYTLPPDSKPFQHLRKDWGKKRILDIGSGTHPYLTKEGVTVRVDSDEKVQPDYRSDLRRLPFAEDEFDVVFSPALEQFDKAETLDILKEWVRVLKPKGELRLIVGNPKWIAEEMGSGRLDPAQVFDKRRTAFTWETLSALLAEAGMERSELADSDSAHLAVKGIKA